MKKYLLIAMMLGFSCSLVEGAMASDFTDEEIQVLKEVAQKKIKKANKAKDGIKVKKDKKNKKGKKDKKKGKKKKKTEPESED